MRTSFWKVVYLLILVLGASDIHEKHYGWASIMFGIVFLNVAEDFYNLLRDDR